MPLPARRWGTLRLAVAAWLILVCGGIALGGATVDSAVLVSSLRTAENSTFAHGQRQGPFALVLVVDAARPDQFDLHRMPNLARLVRGGTQYTRAWVGQLPSITETSHATIGTGVLPSRHLVLGDTWRVPGKDQMSPNLLSAQLDRTGYIGNFIKQSGSPSIAALVHQHFPGSIVVALSGHKIYAADDLGAGSADFVAFGNTDSRQHYVPGAIPGHEPSPSILTSPQLDLPTYPRQPGVEDGWTTTLAEKFLFKYHPRLMLVNLPEVDVTGHLVGTNATVMQPLFANVDRQIGRLIAAYGRAGMLSQTYIIITSDHAMIPALHLVKSTRLEQIILKAGGKPLYVGHGDYSPIWLKNVSAVPQVAFALGNANIPNVAAVFMKNANGGYDLVSSPSHLFEPGVTQAYSDLLASFNSSESADILLLYDENTITMTPTFQRIGRKGDHGGATWGAQHIPLVLAGPGVRQGYTSQYPARLVDIAPTLETLLGIRPEHQDGVPLADAMLQAPAWAVAAQNRVSAQQWADVTELQREAASQPTAAP